MYLKLVQYREEWGNADAPLNTELGRWVATQRRLRAAGRLPEDQVSALTELGLSWSSPSALDADDVAALPAAEWDDLVKRFAAYVADHDGDAQVPKKYQPDPKLGGWVAAVRRAGRRGLGDEGRAAQLDALGFAWISTRQCGSAFMSSWREVRDFELAHGHVRVGEVLGDDHGLARWCEVTRAAAAKGMISEKRMAYLAQLQGFFPEPAD